MIRISQITLDNSRLAVARFEAARSAILDSFDALGDIELEAFPGRTVKDTLELKILEILNKARNEAGNIVAKYSNKNTSMMVMNHTNMIANIGLDGFPRFPRHSWVKSVCPLQGIFYTFLSIKSAVKCYFNRSGLRERCRASQINCFCRGQTNDCRSLRFPSGTTNQMCKGQNLLSY